MTVVRTVLTSRIGLAGEQSGFCGVSNHDCSTTAFTRTPIPYSHHGDCIGRANFGRGAQPFGPGSPMVQFGARQGQLTPFSRFPGSGYNSRPPEPYARPLGNGD